MNLRTNWAQQQVAGLRDELLRDADNQQAEAHKRVLSASGASDAPFIGGMVAGLRNAAAKVMSKEQTFSPVQIKLVGWLNQEGRFVAQGEGFEANLEYWRPVYTLGYRD